MNIACVIQTIIHLPRIQKELIEPLYSVILILAAIIGWCCGIWCINHWHVKVVHYVILEYGIEKWKIRPFLSSSYKNAILIMVTRPNLNSCTKPILLAAEVFFFFYVFIDIPLSYMFYNFTSSEVLINTLTIPIKWKR